MTDIEAIEQVTQAYKDALNSGDWQKWLDTFTEDARLLMQDQPAINGKNAIAAWAKESFRNYEMQLEFSYQELEITD